MTRYGARGHKDQVREIINGVSAQVVGQTIAALANEQGRLTPSAVLDAARPEDSPIHPCFEWDDSKAAETWRLEQARRLVRAVVIVPDNDRGVPVRAFVSLLEHDAGETDAEAVPRPAYVSTRSAMEDPERRRQLLMRALDEAIAWQKRYEHLEEFARVVAAINDIDATKLGQPQTRRASVTAIPVAQA